ncbi:hypothetical protein SPRG_16283 [Saprolegnia parasitica CBS 223.65]|uniref:Cationic amino acid transporter C-terminal domain-containing protein n=1 Tax=Saprolegnia parasitica (strain CBS 223.65) TaxID=695850 RepID=A0A067BNJ7_SAPPC|nr:hypothetical protein SPRG_16283 [Saprolegnia parasitica CBS 223.65]KDO18320.1 hypothetical protein SPRG_16283 [Saprolegnia parasitica CBS 223.65]|eukprot:XP_012210969.1 hypothetical protein SPRG_16283 [Saprolegnia parasitica CBS 223.65]
MGFIDDLFRTKPIEVIEAEERKEELPRELGLRDLILIGIGGTVGTGVFATTGDIISGAAGAAAFVSWLIAGFSCILSGFAYMEMSSLIPSSGSTYAYSYHVLGELPAAIAAWLLTLEYGMSGAGVARSWGTKVQEWAREGLPEGSTKVDWLNMEYYSFLACLIFALSVGVLLGGMKFGKIFINVFTGTKVVIVLFVIIAGFAMTDTVNFTPFVPDFVPATDEDTAKFGVQGVMLGASQAFFGYVGFDEVCCLAAEAKDPRRVMPRAVIGTVLGTMILSAFASLALSAMMPYDAETPFGFNFSAGFRYVGLDWAATIVHIGETGTMPIVVLIAFLAQPRLMYAMSVDGLLPKIFGKVEKNGNLFWSTFLCGGFFCLVALFVPFSYLWNLVSFGILMSFNMTNSALILNRTRDSSAHIVYKLTGALVATSCLSMFLFEKGYVEATDAATGYLVVSMVLLALVLAIAITIFVKCPQNVGPRECYRAPLVPFVPALAITINWFLIAQLPARDIGYGFIWIGVAIDGWATMLNDGYIGHNAVRPSMSSMMADQKESILSAKMALQANEH